MAEVRLEGRQPGCRPEHVRSRLAASGRKPRPAWSVRLRGVRPLRLPAASWTRGDHRAADPRRGRCSDPPAILAAAIFATTGAAPTGIRLSTGAHLHSIGNRPPRLNVATGCMVGFLWPSGHVDGIAARCSGKGDPHARPLYPASPTAGSSGTTWPSSSLSSSRPGPVSARGPASLTHPSSSGGGLALIAEGFSPFTSTVVDDGLDVRRRASRASSCSGDADGARREKVTPGSGTTARRRGAPER